MIDAKGFRQAIGIILVNGDQRVFLAKRIGQNSWQFPQGGMQENEHVEQSMYRELHEETGLSQADVTVMAQTERWLYYRLPKTLIRRNSRPLCIGQKQKWFLLKLVGDESHIRFDATSKPEFDAWKWVDYWYPLEEVIDFKYKVYKLALKEFAPIVFKSTRRRNRLFGRRSCIS